MVQEHNISTRLSSATLVACNKARHETPACSRKLPAAAAMSNGCHQAHTVPQRLSSPMRSLRKAFKKAEVEDDRGKAEDTPVAPAAQW